MVIPLSVCQLFERLINMRTNGNSRTQIHRSSFNGIKCTGRNQGCIYRDICVGGNHQRMIQDLRTRNTGKIEITMVRQIHNSRFVCCSLIFDIDSIIVRQCICNLKVQIPGETGFTVLGEIRQFHTLVIYLFGIPNNRMVTFRTTMQAMPIVIQRKLVFHTVQRELTICDTVSITTDQSAVIIVWIVHILLDIIVSQDNVRHFAILVRNHNRHQAPTPVCHTGFRTILVLQHI